MKPVVLLLLASSVLIGCGSGPYYVAADIQTYEVRGTPADIQILTTQPTGSFMTVGAIDWEMVRFGFRGPTFEDAAPKLRQLAWEHGGDAIVVRHAAEGNTYWTLGIVADVIRFRK